MRRNIRHRSTGDQTQVRAHRFRHSDQLQLQKETVKSLKTGKSFHEQVNAEVYHRAGAITLGHHWMKCHMPDRRSTRDRKAGWIIEIPLVRQADLKLQEESEWS